MADAPVYIYIYTGIQCWILWFHLTDLLTFPRSNSWWIGIKLTGGITGSASVIGFYLSSKVVRINGRWSDDSTMVHPLIQNTWEWLSATWETSYIFILGPWMSHQHWSWFMLSKGLFSFHRQQTSICSPRSIYHRALSSSHSQPDHPAPTPTPTSTSRSIKVSQHRSEHVCRGPTTQGSKCSNGSVLSAPVTHKIINSGPVLNCVAMYVAKTTR